MSGAEAGEDAGPAGDAGAGAEPPESDVAPEAEPAPESNRDPESESAPSEPPPDVVTEPAVEPVVTEPAVIESEPVAERSAIQPDARSNGASIIRDVPPKVTAHQDVAPSGGTATASPGAEPGVDERPAMEASGDGDSAAASTGAVAVLAAVTLPTANADDDTVTAPGATPNEQARVIERIVAPTGSALLNSSPQAPVGLVSTLLGFFDAVRRELGRLFFNERPTFTYDSSQNVEDEATISGRVVPVDPDSTTFTFTASDPAHGSVVMHSDGSFVYTPDEGYSGPDSFRVTISDADDGFHIHGFGGLLHLLTFGLLGDPGHSTTMAVGVVRKAGAVSGFERSTIVEGLDTPTDMRFLPDGRILVAEKGGSIKVVDGSAVQSQPVITFGVDTDAARGLNGIEIDPDFESNGYVYVSYIDAQNVQQLSRITVDDPSADELIADPDTEIVLIRGTAQAADDHHGGEIRIIDGQLYWAVGDNGWYRNSSVISQNSQDLSNIYGKVLRINLDGSIPTDNPFYDVVGARQEIYALGLRNPFRGSVTPDGRLILGDVGQGTWEEVNLITEGGNYGWPYAEGVCPGPGVCLPGSGSEELIDPLHAYNHDGVASSITSALAYDGDGFGGTGHLVFIADFNRQWIKVLSCDSGYTSCGAAMDFDGQAGPTTRLLQGPDGSIYQLTIAGVLARLTPTPAPLTI